MEWAKPKSTPKRATHKTDSSQVSNKMTRLISQCYLAQIVPIQRTKLMTLRAPLKVRLYTSTRAKCLVKRGALLPQVLASVAEKPRCGFRTKVRGRSDLKSSGRERS